MEIPKINACLLSKTQLDRMGMSASGGNEVPKINAYDCLLSKAQRDRMGMSASGDNEVPGDVHGLERLQNKKFNKGLAFNLAERQLLGIHGLLPAVVRTAEEQVAHCKILLDRLENDLDKYMYLSSLAEHNERLYYQVILSDVAQILPLVSTPTVGLACQNYSLIYQKPRGLFITIKDKGHVYDVLKNWPETDVRAIVVTDGERTLGFGDLGAHSMGIPVAKLTLYVALAGFKPSQCLPITLDVGTNTELLLKDPLYIGIREQRATGNAYEEFIEEFMCAVVRRCGQNCLIQFEDFGNNNAFRLMTKYRNDYCAFVNDIQGTAAAVLAGLMASLKIRGTKFDEDRVLFFGAGEGALGTAHFYLIALMKYGLSEIEARKSIWLFDSKGLVVQNRPAGGLTVQKLALAQDHKPVENLDEVVRIIRPSVLIGLSTKGGAFKPKILRMMAEFNEKPIIFALSNPTCKSECTAEQAYKYTNGKCIFASGSPFKPVAYKSKIFHPGQCNDSYIFPGIALGVVSAGMLTIPEEIFLLAAERLADMCSDEYLAKGSLYPPLSKLRDCSLNIAVCVMEYAYDNGLASLHPEPSDKLNFIKSHMYDFSYPSSVSQVYSWDNK